MAELMKKGEEAREGKFAIHKGEKDVARLLSLWGRGNPSGNNKNTFRFNYLIQSGEKEHKCRN